MRKQTVMWTALPNGVRVDDAGVRYLRLSAFVSVRLETNEGPDPTLSQFPDFLAWQALFPGSTPLNSFQFKDFSDRRIRSYPVRHIVSFLRDEYVRIATQFPTEFRRVLRSEEHTSKLHSRRHHVCRYL